MAEKKTHMQLFQPVDLTQGTCWKTILVFSLPVILSYLLQQIYTISDAAIVGQTLTAAEVAGVNDTNSLVFIFLQFAFGVSAGFCVITSYYVGMHDERGVRRSLATQLLLSAALTVVLTALAMALAQPMAHLFVGYDADLFALTVHAFRLFAWSFLLAGFNIFTSGFFTALNNGAVSAAISFLRTLVFQSASVLILPVFFGVDGIWWAITVAEVFAFLISGMFLLLKRNKYHYM